MSAHRSAGYVPPSETESSLPRRFRIQGSEAHFVALPARSFNHTSLTNMTLLTVINYDEDGPVSLKWLRETIEIYDKADDVWQYDFLESVLITHSTPPKLEIKSEARQYLVQHGTKRIATQLIRQGVDPTSPGPYAISAHGLHTVWRLYEDTHNAFLHTLIQDSNSNPINFRTAGTVPQTLMVGVPSRVPVLYGNSTFANQPLIGMRIAVKDNIHIQGVRMSACSRAYYELYPPAPRTAKCIQQLRDAGAVLVGTTKLASFAATEEPIECIDWQAPWNPRADGYQSPAGSSSGSGVAVAAYDWLDIPVGTDASGSGRRPGLWNGCFAMRPTYGLLSYEGLLPSFPRFDTPTFFGRNLDTCKEFAKRLDYMDLIKNEEQMKIINAYVADLEASLGVKHQRLSFNKVWDADPPVEAGSAGLQEYMKDVSRDSFFYEDYHNFDQFREDYRTKFGKDPYVSPPVRWQWDLSSHITVEANEEAMKRLEVYKDWFMRAVMKPEEKNTLVLIPIEEISPRYRDDATSWFNPVGVPNLFLSPIWGAPELTIPSETLGGYDVWSDRSDTIPVGEFSFKSKCSGNMEKLPIAISRMAAPGQDLLLFEVASECLRKSGRPTEVSAGKTLFPPNNATTG